MSLRGAIAVALVVTSSSVLIAAARAADAIDYAEIEDLLRQQRELLKPEPMNLGAEQPQTGPDFDTVIAEARQAFFEAYRRGQGLSDATARFGRLLAVKDQVCLWSELWYSDVPAQRATYQMLSKIDGGIIPGARREFDDWVDVIKSKAQGGDGFTVLLRRAQFSGTFPKYQAAYVAARNWAEFDRAQIQYDPREFAWMLVQRYPNAKGFEATAPNFKAILELFGAERVIEAAKKLSALPRDAENRCAGLDRLGLNPASKELTSRHINATRKVRPLDPAHAYVVFVALIARDNARRGFLVDGYTGAQTATDDQDWIRLRDRYRRLVLGYGQQRVDETAEKCATTGANVWHRLAAADPDGYLRFTLADGEQLDSVKAIDARVAELNAHAGEAEVRRVAARVRDAQAAGEDLTEFGSGLGDPCSAIVSTLKPPTPNNPWYRAWARFPVGSKSVYRQRSENAPALAKDDYTEKTYELLSVERRKVVVRYSQRDISQGIEIRSGQQEIEYPATLDAQHAYITAIHYTEGSLPISAVDVRVEALPVKGISLDCTKRLGTHPSGMTETMWVSEQVPGGIVKLQKGLVTAARQVVPHDRLLLDHFEGKPAAEAAEPAGKGKSCTNCATQLAAGAESCTWCGVKITTSQSAVAQEAKESSEAGDAARRAAGRRGTPSVPRPR